MALMLTFAGVYQFVLGLARMGALVNFVSHSVVVGFTAGAAILIATSQLKHFLGIKIPAGESFLHTWQDIYRQLHEINPYVTAIAAVTLIAGVLFIRFKPRWPGMLFAMIFGSLLAALLAYEPKTFSLSASCRRTCRRFPCPIFRSNPSRPWAGALAIAMLAVEAVSIAKSVAQVRSASTATRSSSARACPTWSAAFFRATPHPARSPAAASTTRPARSRPWPRFLPLLPWR
jgi:SulP family sulfate permease